MKHGKRILVLLLLVTVAIALTGCVDDATTRDADRTYNMGVKLAENQPTPDDIEYSLERYNLIRRTYWVNGMREKAISLPSPVRRPLGYCILLLEGVGVVGRFTVDGKVSSLNSFLTPDSKYYSLDSSINIWLPDVDGSYGVNDGGIFFFTTDGKYIEWSGEYLYSDIPFEVDDPILTVKGGK